MDDLFDAKAGPLEKTRLQGVMMKWRSIFRGMTEAKGCAKVKQEITEWFGAENIRAAGGGSAFAP